MTRKEFEKKYELFKSEFLNLCKKYDLGVFSEDPYCSVCILSLKNIEDYNKGIYTLEETIKYFDDDLDLEL